MSAQFFFDRWQRAVQMDLANKLQGKPTHYWIQADEWLEAYKRTLSNNQLDKFNKEWRKCEEDLNDRRHEVDWGKKPKGKR